MRCRSPENRQADVTKFFSKSFPQRGRVKFYRQGGAPLFVKFARGTKELVRPTVPGGKFKSHRDPKETFPVNVQEVETFPGEAC